MFLQGDGDGWWMYLLLRAFDMDAVGETVEEA